MVLSKVATKGPTIAHHLVGQSMRRWLSSAANASHGKHEPNPDLWRKVFLFVCIPAIGLSAVNTYLTESEHHEHHQRPEFRKMEYMYKRASPFPWGDGNHTLFHNPKYNPLPEGWEELPEESAHNKH